MSVKSIPRTQLKKILRHDVQLVKVTLTDIPSGSISIYESSYGQRLETRNTFNIKAEVQPITMEQALQYPPGVVHHGDAWGFFLPYYMLEGSQYTVNPEDKIICETIEYEVKRIEDHYQGNKTVWRRAYMIRLGGDGS